MSTEHLRKREGKRDKGRRKAGGGREGGRERAFVTEPPRQFS